MRRVLGFGDVIEENNELIAPEPGRGVVGSQASLEPGGDGLEQQIAARMAEGVVDDLETVEVEEQDGAAPFLALCPRQRLIEPVVEQQAVGEPGERVVVGHVIQLRLGPAHGADIGEGDDVMARRAALVPHHAHVLPDREDVPFLCRQ